jgi:hypothetical protein
MTSMWPFTSLWGNVPLAFVCVGENPTCTYIGPRVRLFQGLKLGYLF